MNPKYQKVLSDIEKAEKKKTEIEGQLKELYDKKTCLLSTSILNNFKTLGVRTEPLSGYDRLKVLHDVFNMDTNEPFRFSFAMCIRDSSSTMISTGRTDRQGQRSRSPTIIAFVKTLFNGVNLSNARKGGQCK